MSELRPLLSKHQIEEDSDIDSDESSESESLQLSSFQVPSYGSQSSSAGRFVPLAERTTYSWNNLNVFSSGTDVGNVFNCFKSRTAEQKLILQNANGIARPGELMAIMGSSGAGKTTLLNALTFRSTKHTKVTGTRFINGIPVTSRQVSGKLAYIPQDDLFIGNLTVKEHLVFQALVRMDRDITYEDRMERVAVVMEDLSLSKCADTQIGIPDRVKGISGGEQRRLSFASEVLTNPPLMFCDEPTSGLDSFMAFNVVQLLKGMAYTGKNIICTIHQPSSELYALFDKILLVADGRIAFLGTPGEAELFFKEVEAPCPKHYNPADHYVQVLAIEPENEESSRQAVTMICDKFDGSELGMLLAAESATKASMSEIQFGDSGKWLNGSSYKASWFAQFRAVLWRSWITILKEPFLIKVRTVQTLMVSILLGTIYFGQQNNQDGVMNINGVIYIFLTNMTFQNVFAVINVFCSELPIFLKENRDRMYRTDVYFLSKTIAEAPIFIVLPIIYTSCAYYMIGLTPRIDKFFIACGILTLVANVATSFGYLVSCLATSTSMALSVGPPIIMPLLLFGGFFLNIDSIPSYLEWISYFSWFRYGNEALLINQWENVTDIDCPPGETTCPPNGQVVLDLLSFKKMVLNRLQHPKHWGKTMFESLSDLLTFMASYTENFVPDILALVSLILGLRLLALLALIWKTHKNER